MFDIFAITAFLSGLTLYAAYHACKAVKAKELD
jgi:hypothetical protein